MNQPSPKIIALPEESMFDSDLETFKITGLQPNKEYHLTVRLHHKSTFMSTTVFRADETGTIDVGESCAYHGHYHGKDRMGLFTSLYHETTARFGTKISLMPMPDYLEYTIQLQERKGFAPGKVITETKIKRILKAKELERIEVEHDIIEGVLFKPKGNGPFRCVIDIYGFLGMQEHRAALLAHKGFAVLALRTFGGKKTPPLLNFMDASYLSKAVDYLQGQQFCSGSIGVIGISAGAISALYLASKNANVAATVAINGTVTPREHTVFKENGKFMKFHSTSHDDFRNIAFKNGAYNYSKCDLGVDYPEEIQFKVENSKGKFLFIAGEEDGTTNSVDHAKLLMARLTRAGKSEMGRVIIAPQSGHTIDPAFVPTIDTAYAKNIDVMLDFGGHVYFHGVQQRKIWPQIIKFFEENIPLNDSKPLCKL